MLFSLMVADGSRLLGVRSPSSSPANMLSTAFHRMSCTLSRDFPLAHIYLDTPESSSLSSLGDCDAATSALL